jgi:hypothetical protein
VYFSKETLDEGIGGWREGAGFTFAVDARHEGLWHYSPLRSWLQWHVKSLTGAMLKPVIGLFVLCITLFETVVRVAWLSFMTCLFPLWMFSTLTTSIKLGEREHSQTWMSE